MKHCCLVLISQLILIRLLDTDDQLKGEVLRMQLPCLSTHISHSQNKTTNSLRLNNRQVLRHSEVEKACLVIANISDSMKKKWYPPKKSS
ncbi:unnamed protein product [Heterobilharzia americana]|nr:unnamed protein product [Heterobilharzia americana]